jgi:hypothetical protein
MFGSRREFGFNDVTGLAYLEGRIRQGDQNAQENLNRAASVGGLGFDDVTGRPYLEERLRQGDQHVQQMLNRAARYNKLGFNDITGRAYLEGRVRNNPVDQHAQEMLNEAASRKELGFDYATGPTYLEDRACYGDQDAQNRLSGGHLLAPFSIRETQTKISTAFFFHFYNAISG